MKACQAARLDSEVEICHVFSEMFHAFLGSSSLNTYMYLGFMAQCSWACTHVLEREYTNALDACVLSAHFRCAAGNSSMSLVYV